MNKFTASELRARIQSQVFPSLLQSAEDERRKIADWISKSCRFDKYGAGCDDIKEDRYSLRDGGRNPDGTGESYAERNL